MQARLKYWEKRDSSTAQGDSFARVKEKKSVSLLGSE
jgi:hypothetical protein